MRLVFTGTNRARWFGVKTSRVRGGLTEIARPKGCVCLPRYNNEWGVCLLRPSSQTGCVGFKNEHHRCVWGAFGSAIKTAGGGGVRRLGFNHPPGDFGSGMGSGDSRGGCRDRGVSGQARDSRETDESLAKHKASELEIESLLRVVVSQDIMSIVQSNSVIDISNLQTELEPYNDMQQKIKRLQAQLGDQKGKSKDTPCVSNTLDPLPQKLKNENVELRFQIRNYEKENAHLKSAYKNLFDSINLSHAQTKGITASLQNKLNDMIYENMTLRAQLSDKVSKKKDTTKGTSLNTQFCKQSILGKPPSSSRLKLYFVTPFPKSKGDCPGMFRIDPSKTSRENKFVSINKVRASVRRKPITISQPHVNTNKDVNSDSNGFSSTGVNITAKTRRPQPKSNTKNDGVPSMSKNSCIMKKEVEVEEHHRNLLLSKNKKHMSSECNNVKPAIRNAKTKVVYAMCKQCLITANHDVCVLKYVNDMDFCGKKQKPEVKKPKKVGSKERLASPTPSEPSITRRWSPTGIMFDCNGKIIKSKAFKGQSNGDKACTSSNPQEHSSKRFPNPTSFLGRNLEGVDLLKGNHTTNLYTINLHELTSASPICLMARATSTKSVYNRRTKKIIETMNVTFDELSPMAFKQTSSKTRLQGMNSGQISLGLNLTYDSSTITTQKLTERELDLLFEAMYDDYIGGQPSAATRTALAAQAP
ncbi:hypothetical protein Tco_0678575 [Tanacetum coccineum]|uniref:Uncharacterized protein n=1 Tax=Tanacetum coccineum TaxID=301880 RepID=A0ABQ4XFN2_9ASTR